MVNSFVWLKGSANKDRKNGRKHASVFEYGTWSRLQVKGLDDLIGVGLLRTEELK